MQVHICVKARGHVGCFLQLFPTIVFGQDFPLLTDQQGPPHHPPVSASLGLVPFVQVPLL